MVLNLKTSVTSVWQKVKVTLIWGLLSSSETTLFVYFKLLKDLVFKRFTSVFKISII
jgi:hypothetical protein